MKESAVHNLAVSEYFWLRRLPKPVKNATRAGITFAAIVGGTACEASSSQSPSGTDSGSASPVESQKIQDNSVESITEYSSQHFLELPFPKNGNMHIQQGWTEPSSPNHHGIDYINGQVNNSPWATFPVLAAADGKACFNPPSHIGKAILIQHRVNGSPIYTYYGHLTDYSHDIPDCQSGTGKIVHRGDKIGDAGADEVTDNGVPQPTWIHLHFQVNGPDGSTPIDPYDKRMSADQYPDPSNANGKTCGLNYLWVECPEGQDPTPAATATKAPILPSPGPKPEPATPTATTRPEPATPRPEPVLLSAFERAVFDRLNVLRVVRPNLQLSPVLEGVAEKCRDSLLGVGFKPLNTDEVRSQCALDQLVQRLGYRGEFDLMGFKNFMIILAPDPVDNFADHYIEGAPNYNPLNAAKYQWMGIACLPIREFPFVAADGKRFTAYDYGCVMVFGTTEG